MSGPGALCVGARRFVSGSVSGPAVLSRRSFCRGPASVSLSVGARRSVFVGPGALCQGPALLVSGSGAPCVRRSLCVGARRCVGACVGPTCFVGHCGLSSAGPRLLLAGSQLRSVAPCHPSIQLPSCQLRSPSSSNLRATHPVPIRVPPIGPGSRGPPAPIRVLPQPRAPPAPIRVPPIRPGAFPFSRREPQTLLFGGKYENDME